MEGKVEQAQTALKGGLDPPAEQTPAPLQGDLGFSVKWP